MSDFINDSLQKQIERGEVFYSGAAATNLFSRESSLIIAVETGANECFFRTEIITEATIGFSVYKDVTSFVSTSSRAVFNMKISDTSTVMNTTVDQASSYVGGSLIYTGRGIDGRFPQNSPLNLEAGLLLKPNTIFVYELANEGAGPTAITITSLLREI